MKKIVGYPEILNYDWNITSSIPARFKFDTISWVITFNIKNLPNQYELELLEGDEFPSILRVQRYRRQKSHLNEKSFTDLSNKLMFELNRCISSNPEIIKELKFIPKEVKEKNKAIFDAIELNLL